jgi:hypothetical protein
MTGYKFRLSTKAMVGESSILLIVIPLLGIAFCLGALAVMVVGSDQAGLARFALSVISTLMALIFVAASCVMLLGAVGRAIFSYLMLSEAGLEYRYWPVHRIRCAWNQVGEIKKSPVAPLQGDVLMLQQAEVSGFHMLFDFQGGKYGFTKTIPMIPLYRLDGWPNGRLETELRRYAPGLFDE